MSTPKQPQPVKLITSILAQKHTDTEPVRSRLESEFGPADIATDYMLFDFTDYYESELGTDLSRRILGFKTLVPPDALPDIKHTANEIEQDYTRGDGTRTVNIDPGYIALGHFILATGKPFAHRPYLRDGIYADMTLIFKGKTFRPLPWSFPDYASEGMILLLNSIRERYYRQLHERGLL